MLWPELTLNEPKFFIVLLVVKWARTALWWWSTTAASGQNNFNLNIQDECVPSSVVFNWNIFEKFISRFSLIGFSHTSFCNNTIKYAHLTYGAI